MRGQRRAPGVEGYRAIGQGVRLDEDGLRIGATAIDDPREYLPGDGVAVGLPRDRDHHPIVADSRLIRASRIISLPAAAQADVAVEPTVDRDGEPAAAVGHVL